LHTAGRATPAAPRRPDVSRDEVLGSRGERARATGSGRLFALFTRLRRSPLQQAPRSLPHLPRRRSGSQVAAIKRERRQVATRGQILESVARPLRRGECHAIAMQNRLVDGVRPLAEGRETRMRKLLALIRREEGQDLAEYALLISLIALVAIAGVTLLGTRVNQIFNAIAGAI
jgi:pilus assembly protein Flp/PilA